MTARALALSLAALGVTLGAHLAAAQPEGHRALPYLAVHLGLTALMLVAWRTLRTPGELRVALAAGLAMRAVLIPVAPFTTTDVERYLWDGAVLLAGRDPYALTPLAPALDALRATVPLPLDHLDVSTCYPPTGIFLFALAALTHTHALLAWKALCAAASSLTAYAIARHLRDSARPHDMVLAAWSPVLILEAGVGAHLETFSVLFVAAAVALLARRRLALSALCAGMAVSVKLLPIFVTMTLALRSRRPVWYGALAMAPVALTMAVAEVMGLTAFGSLPNMAENWSFASPLWSALYHHFSEEHGAIRVGLALAALLGVTLASLRRDVGAAARDALTVQVAVSPVMYPWYGAPLAAAAAMAPGYTALAVTAALPLSYEVIDGYRGAGVWAPAWWPVAVNAAMLGGGLAADLHAAARRLRRR